MRQGAIRRAETYDPPRLIAKRTSNLRDQEPPGRATRGHRPSILQSLPRRRRPATSVRVAGAGMIKGRESKKAMLIRRTFIAAGMALAVFGTPVRGQADALAERAHKFVESMADKAVAALTAKDISRRERARRFRVLLKEHFAVKTIGQWALGRYWRRATTAERVEYLALFEDLIVDTYADRFQRYSGETLSIIKTVSRGNNDAIVYSLITRPGGGKPIRVNWRVRSAGDIQRVVDVIVEGISMGQTQRSEFASVIRANGGDVEGLLNELRKKKNKRKKESKKDA